MLAEPGRANTQPRARRVRGEREFSFALVEHIITQNAEKRKFAKRAKHAKRVKCAKKILGDRVDVAREVRSTEILKSKIKLTLYSIVGILQVVYCSPPTLLEIE